MVHPSLPVKTIADLVKLTKAQPGEMNYGSTGAGSATFLAAELFKGMAGINIVHVPYRGGGEAVTAILSGEVSVYLRLPNPIPCLTQTNREFHFHIPRAVIGHWVINFVEARQ